MTATILCEIKGKRSRLMVLKKELISSDLQLHLLHRHLLSDLQQDNPISSLQ